MKFQFLEKKTNIKELILLLFLVLMFSLFEYVGWFTPLRIVANKLLIPLFEVDNILIHKIKTPYDFILFSFNKFKYTKQLELKYTESLSQLSELDKFREENIQLKKLIENNDLKIEKKTIAAPIVSLAYPAVGVGSVSGVEVNNMVLLNGMLIGTIDKVGNYQSSVSLLSRPRKKKVLAKTESGIEGVVDGDGKNVLLTQIIRNTNLINGERVVSVGQEGIEKNTFIGTLRVIDNTPSAPTQTAIIVQDSSFYDAVLLEIK